MHLVPKCCCILILKEHIQRMHGTIEYMSSMCKPNIPFSASQHFMIYIIDNIFSIILVLEKIFMKERHGAAEIVQLIKHWLCKHEYLSSLFRIHV